MRYAALACFLFVLALPAAAFDPEEHRQMSNEAVSLEKSDAAIELQNLPPGLLDAESKYSFGDVTLAVDWFTDPDDLFETDNYRGALDRRRRNFVLRGYAVYRNSTHFQRKALEQWSAHHEAAIEHAKKNMHGQALLREAIALHYLQDFFSAGHVVTPRAKMHSSVAGLLHDRYNERGVPFLIDGEEAVVQFHGDGTLMTEDRQKQREFVLEMSRLSVREVLLARDGSEPEERLQTCFENRSVKQVDERVEITPPVGAIRRIREQAPRVVDR